MPKLPVQKSIATPSLLAHVATSKYVDALTLYRQEKIFQRLGIDQATVVAAYYDEDDGTGQPCGSDVDPEKTGFVEASTTVFMTAFEPISDRWEPVVWLSALATMVIGNFAALLQDNIKRLLAYS